MTMHALTPIAVELLPRSNILSTVNLSDEPVEELFDDNKL